jgi:hypothetical protein
MKQVRFANRRPSPLPWSREATTHVRGQIVGYGFCGSQCSGNNAKPKRLVPLARLVQREARTLMHLRSEFLKILLLSALPRITEGSAYRFVCERSNADPILDREFIPHIAMLHEESGP